MPSAVSGGGDDHNGNIGAFVRESSQADTRNKVQDWLTADTGSSSELSSDVQQQLQQLQKLQQQQGVQQQTSSTFQQQQQESGAQTAAAGAPAAAAAAAAARQAGDVCTAEDSPFFRLLPPCFSSGSVELGAFTQAAAPGNKAAAGAAAAAAAGGGGFGNTLPSFMDPK
jgi:hypothetical protein